MEVRQNISAAVVKEETATLLTSGGESYESRNEGSAYWPSDDEFPEEFDQTEMDKLYDDVDKIGAPSEADREEQMLPLDQRRPGVSGYQPVLPALWQALVAGDGWQPSELWQALSWGPSAFLGQEPESLQPGSQRWLLFDPEQAHQPRAGSLAANGPLAAQALKGQLLASGLLPVAQWSLDQG